jgi:hypothetical protein
MNTFDTIITLGGPTPEESFQRVDRTIDLMKQGVAEHCIVTGAVWAFARGDAPAETIGQRMRAYAIDNGSFLGRRGQWLYEVAGGVLCNRVLHGTKPGDDAAIQERLLALVPGYTAASKAGILENHLRDLLHLPITAAKPILW